MGESPTFEGLITPHSVTRAMSDDSNSSEYNFSFRRFIVLVAILLALTLLTGGAVAVKTELTVYESMSVIGVLASIALSAILAYLYYRMSRIQDLQHTESVRQANLQEDLADHQEKQNELMQLQQEMRELEYQPKILIDDYELKPSGIELTLRNLGRGLAEHIAVRAQLRVKGIRVEPANNPDSDSEGSLYIPDEVFYRDPETNTEYVPWITETIRTEGEEMLSKQRRGGMLSPDEGAVEFAARVRFGRVDPVRDGVGGVPPARVFSELYEAGMGDVTFQLDLLYCNELGGGCRLSRLWVRAVS